MFKSNAWKTTFILDRSLAPSIIREIDNLVVTHHRLITPVGVIEDSRGLSEATPPDVVAGYIVDPEGITADSRRNLRSLQDQSQISANYCEATFRLVCSCVVNVLCADHRSGQFEFEPS
jgi:hypothetical protein